MPLKPKQALFVKHYLVHKNATKAALLAGYSKKTARAMGTENLTKPAISQLIKAGLTALAEKTQLSAELILRELLLIARSDVADAYDEKGNLKPIHEIPEEIRRVISGIKVHEEFITTRGKRIKVGEIREVKLWDKTRALELLAKHLKLLQPDTIPVTLNLNATLVKVDREALKTAIEEIERDV